MYLAFSYDELKDLIRLTEAGLSYREEAISNQNVQSLATKFCY